MASFYKILKADPLGEPWTPSKPGSKPIQSWWCQVENQDWAVSIGRQVDNPLHPGVHVYGDLTYAKSQRGNEYWKFKSLQVPEGVARPTDAPGSPAQATAQQATGQKPPHYGQTNGGYPDMSARMPDWFVPVYNMIDYIHKQMKQMDTETSQPAQATTQAEPPAQAVDQAVLDDMFNEPEV